MNMAYVMSQISHCTLHKFFSFKIEIKTEADSYNGSKNCLDVWLFHIT
jgi:hypothetical protein